MFSWSRANSWACPLVQEGQGSWWLRELILYFRLFVKEKVSGIWGYLRPGSCPVTLVNQGITGAQKETSRDDHSKHFLGIFYDTKLEAFLTLGKSVS